MCSLGVKCFAEFHDIDAVLTQRRADWRRRVGFAGGNLQFYVTCNFISDLLISNWKLPIADFAVSYVISYFKSLQLLRRLSIGNRQSKLGNRTSFFFRESYFLDIQEIQFHWS